MKFCFKNAVRRYSFANKQLLLLNNQKGFGKIGGKRKEKHLAKKLCRAIFAVP
jgi:hypothetical protein